MVRPVTVAGVWALKLSLHSAAPFPSLVNAGAALDPSHQEQLEMYDSSCYIRCTLHKLP